MKPPKPGVERLTVDIPSDLASEFTQVVDSVSPVPHQFQPALDALVSEALAVWLEDATVASERGELVLWRHRRRPRRLHPLPELPPQMSPADAPAPVPVRSSPAPGSGGLANETRK